MNHPISHATTYVGSQLFGGRLKQWQEQADVTIGNDVWIGHGAILLPGVVVGDGAIIGAGAVVTHDVAPFSISAGNPAKQLRSRFSAEIISALSTLRWWDYSAEELAQFEELFHLDLATNSGRALNWLSSHTHDGRFRMPGDQTTN